MEAEYKRDLNHNYLILHGEEEVDTSTYPVRMVLSNAIPCLLSCRLQSMNGQALLYYDITSRQTVSAVFEKRKVGARELKQLFGGILEALESLSAFLMNPDHLVLRPEYLYMDVETGTLYFCYVPGHGRDVRQQFREFCEYLLPKIDHQEEQAVVQGYGVYRRVMEEQFSFQDLEESLYGAQEEEIHFEKTKRKSVKEPELAPEEAEPMELPPEWSGSFSSRREEEKIAGHRTREEKKEKADWLPCFLGVGVMTILFLGIAGAKKLGYVPWLDASLLLGILLVGGGIFFLIWMIYCNQKRKKEAPVLPGSLEKEWERENVPEEKRKGEEPERFQAEEKGREDFPREELAETYGETVILSSSQQNRKAALVSKEPGLLATIVLEEELTVIGKLPMAADVVIPVETVSRIHAKIRKEGEDYYLSDLNSRNGTSVNGQMLQGDERYCLKEQDEVHFGGAVYVFLK